MGEPTDESVFELVSKKGPILAKDVAKALGTVKKAVNPGLYRLKTAGRLSCDAAEPPLWSVARAPVAAPKVDPKRSRSSRRAQAIAGDLPPLPPPNWAPAPGGPQPAVARIPDADQDAIVAAPVDARVVVEAGPGYGKTDVACARVARLLSGGLTGAQILLLSFTRTAVREMRTRITRLAPSNSDVLGVEIRTIDSFVWGVNRGLSPQGVEGLGGFEESIARSLRLFDETGDMAAAIDEALARYKHVLVDEAQDLVGVRALWTIAFLRRVVRIGAGWTVFMDPAQAIYDWAEEGSGDRDPSSFLRIHQDGLVPFERRRLRTFHRTANLPLTQFLQQVRERVPQGPAAETPTQLRNHLLFIARGEGKDEEVLEWTDRAGKDRDGGLILFRSRAEAFSASSRLAEKGIQHRLRFGGLPRLVAPWIAAVVNHGGQSRMSRVEFDAAWSAIQKANSYLLWGWDADEAWRVLIRLGRPRGSASTQVQVDLVADNLAQRRVPDDLYRKEIGPAGPILGTVHGSKGREAGHVVCCVSDKAREGTQEAEEERVLYVGVSRARNNLEIVRAPLRDWFYHEGRAWRRTSRKPGVMIEVGHDRDLEALGAASADQSALASFDGRFRRVIMKATPVGDRWEKRLFLDGEDNICIGSLTDLCAEHLNAISRQAIQTYCNFLAFLHLVDLTTAAIADDDPRRSALPPALRRTRVWLAPVVVGLGYAPKKK